MRRSSEQLEAETAQRTDAALVKGDRARLHVIDALNENFLAAMIWRPDMTPDMTSEFAVQAHARRKNSNLKSSFSNFNSILFNFHSHEKERIHTTVIVRVVDWHKHRHGATYFNARIGSV